MADTITIDFPNYPDYHKSISQDILLRNGAFTYLSRRCQ
jgi:hypothetical protein